VSTAENEPRRLTPTAAIFRNALQADVLEALDHAEAVRRNLTREDRGGATLGLDADTFGRLSVCVDGAYEALCHARQLLDGAA
jgi:hypothetical protein